MATHPINLGLRFLLELTVLIVVGVWGWKQDESWLKYLLAFGIPIVLAAIWGTFAVADDPSRSGNAPIQTIGWIRLGIELLFFLTGALAFFLLDYKTVSIVFIVITVFHYTISYDRIMWLIQQ